MQHITVNLRDRSYPITIATDLLNNIESFWQLKHGDRAMLVTNERIAPLYLHILQTLLLKYGIKVNNIILPDGEKYKSLNSLDKIFTVMLRNNHGRDTTLIALGGGVIGDITGFAAASYQRGVRLIQVPTTLLSQVDSSVGGKTAVNHPLGKNMIGAFYQPISVVIDLNCLKTLPNREFYSGLAEVIKYGIILDHDFFSWLEINLEALMMMQPHALAYCVKRCCELKASVVASDEREHGLRSLLNLGHTYGHAIETHMGYGNWLHGEAIAAGMMMAVQTAIRIGQFNKDDAERIKVLLSRAKLPIKGPQNMAPEDYLPYMMRDKKVVSGKLRLVLPITIGHSEVYTNVKYDVVLASIKDCQNGNASVVLS